MASINKLPSGTWRALVFVGYDDAGKKKYKSLTGKTKKEVALIAAQLEKDISEGKAKLAEPTRMTVGEAIDKYIADRSNIRSPSTTREDIGYRSRSMQDIMNVKISVLTSEMLQAAINKEAAHLAPKSVRNIWNLVRSALKAADPDRTYTVMLPPKRKTEMNIPTSDELNRLLDRIRHETIYIPVLLAASGGFRRGEIAALDLTRDFDYANNTVTINKSMVIDSENNWQIKQPKSYSGYRTVDLPSSVMEVVKTARDSGYTMPKPSYISTRFADVCEKLDLNIRFHDLRHYNASVMLYLGVPDKYAMERMGHSTPGMLKNVYQHLMADKRDEMTGKINDYFEQNTRTT